MKRIMTLLFTLILGASAIAQEGLSLEQAIQRGLENNFDIRLARKDMAIAANNATPGNAGMLPIIDLRGGANGAVIDTRQEFITGQSQEVSNASTFTYQGGAYLGWRIFDGFAMFATLDRLRELQNLGELQVVMAMLNSVADIQALYARMVQLQAGMEVYEEAIELTQERLRIANHRLELGSGSRLEVLQAQVDYNADRNALLAQKDVLNQTRIALNEAMMERPDQVWMATDSLILDPMPDYAALRQALSNQNPELKMAMARYDISRMQEREAKAMRLPVVDIGTSYRYSKFQSEAGFLLSNRANGVYYEITASIPLYMGRNVQRQITNARIGAERAALEQEALAFRMEGRLAALYASYQAQVEMMELEQQNLGAARENLDVALDSYDLGNISALELREIQQNFILAQNRLLNAQYMAKLAEIEVFTLTGDLAR